LLISKIMSIKALNPAVNRSRRKFLKQFAGLSAFMIVPRFVIGGKGFTPPSDLINLGFIGTGRQSHTLRDYFNKAGGSRIVAAAEVYGYKAKIFLDKTNALYAAQSGKESYDGVRMVTDFRELLAMKDIDAAVIIMPDHWHAIAAIKAMEAGKDVYCEKPLALTIAEGRAMVNAAEKNKKIVQTGSMQRSWPEFRQCVELIRNRYIGEIKTIKVNVGPPPIPYTLPAEPIPDSMNWDLWVGPNTQPVNFNAELAPLTLTEVWANWRKYKEFGGGQMTDWGAHMFDIVQWALDKDDTGPVSITPPDGKNYQALTYRYDNGITVTKEDLELRNSVRFIGSKGQIDIQRGKLITSPDATLKDKVIGGTDKRVYFSENHYSDFLKAIRARTKPICDVETGHRSASMCTLGNIAYQLNRPLQWDPKKEKFRKDDEANALLTRPLKNEWNVLK
jgi:predicted dehydrogenase